MAKDSEVIAGLAKPRGKFPHYRRAGDFIYVSGTSSRRPDDTFEGVEIDENGRKTHDIVAQTRGVLDNIARVLETAGAQLSDVVEVSAYLVNIKDFNKYNDMYGSYFSESGPARTTVAVHELPHPDILIEIKAIAFKPLAG